MACEVQGYLMAAAVPFTSSKPVRLAQAPAAVPDGGPRGASLPVTPTRGAEPASAAATDLLAIVRMLPDVVFRCVKDEKGIIRWTLNEGRLAEEFHVTTKDIQGKSLSEMFPPDVAARQLPHFEAAFRGEAQEWVNEMGGRLFKHYPQPVKDAQGKVVAVVGFITEVTSLVRAQEQAKRLNGELLQRLVQLRETNLSLEQANRDLDGFAAAASHDLRNPLNVIATTLYLLERDAQAPGAPPEQVERLRKVSAATKRMTELTSDLLRFSRSSAQAFHPETVDLSALARDVAAQIAAQEPESKVELRVEDGIRVQADRGLLRVALENLLGNAWKYTARTPKPVVSVASEAKDALGRMVIAIADNGIGFAPAESGRLFQAFQRLSSSQGFPGTGIGLATTRRIIERHGGRIWAEAMPGKGATFRFTLPAAARDPAAA